MFANVIFKSAWHVGFKVHRVDKGSTARLACIELGHSSTSMAKNAIIMGRGISEERISCNIFILMADAGRKT
jgi:hypothetical protein